MRFRNRKWNPFGPWLELRKLPRENWILAFSLFVNRMGTMAFPFLILFLSSQRGFSTAEAGLMLTVYGVSGLIATFFSGYLVDRIEPVHIIKASLFISALAVFLFPFAHSYLSIFLMTMFWGMSAEVLRPAHMTVVSEIAQPQTKKLSFALNRLAANLGMSLGPAIGGFIATHSYEMIFVVDSLTTLIAALILVFYPFRKRAQRLLAQAANPMPPVGSPSRRALTDIPFLFFLLGMFLLMSVYFQHESTLSIFMVKDLNLSPRDYGFVFTINTLLIVAFEVPLNSWTLRFSHRSAMFVGGVLYAIGFGILFWVNSFFGVAISVIIWSFGEMLESPAHSAFISDLAPRKRVGEYMGLLTCAYGLAFAVGPPVGAWILAAYSAKVLWVFCFIAALGGALILGYVKPPIKHGGSA